MDSRSYTEAFDLLGSCGLVITVSDRDVLFPEEKAKSDEKLEACRKPQGSSHAGGGFVHLSTDHRA